MTERDAFEVRFGAAVRGYAGGVTSDLDPVEFARQIAAREPRRRGLVAALGWRRIVAPRHAWALLLLAALFTALVASMIVIGSQPVRKLPAVVPPVGQLFTCPPGTNPDEPGPVGQARPAGQPTVAFDRNAGKVVAVIGPLPVETWTFDVCTNTWTQMHPDQEPEAIDGWDLLVYDVDSDLTVAVDRGTGAAWAYDLQANTWVRKGAAPAGLAVHDGVYDPLSGHVVTLIAEDLWGLRSYDVDTDQWTPIRQWNFPHPGQFAYDASVDRIVVYEDGYADGLETWLLDIRTGTWTRSNAEMPEVVGWWVSPGIVYDEAAELTMVYRRGPLTTFDATADRWEILDEAATSGAFPDPIVYDPVNRRLVGLAEEGGVEALDLVAGDWTVLLAPDDGQLPSAW
jgi:hypothetical protein